MDPVDKGRRVQHSVGMPLAVLDDGPEPTAANPDENARIMNPQDLVHRLQDLPLATEGQSQRIPGSLKVSPEHFQVFETMPYAPCGTGEHVYVTLSRSGWNTEEVAKRLGRVLKVGMRDIGWAGRKDRNALTTQTFSIRMSVRTDLNEIHRTLADQTPFTVTGVDRHTNKIRLGHVLTNDFRIVLAGARAETHLADATAVARRLRETGIPNFFGPQRFGIAYRNVDQAAQLLERGTIQKTRQGRFWVSVLQAAWFNVWLAERMERGDFHRLHAGDVAKKTDTGGLFIVEDAAEAQGRFDNRALTYTGPIFGSKTMAASGEPGDRERALAERLGLDPDRVQKLKAPGSRRPAVIWIDAIGIEPSPDGLVVSFRLPSGSYATTVMREFTGADAASTDPVFADPQA